MNGRFVSWSGPLTCPLFNDCYRQQQTLVLQNPVTAPSL